MISLCKHHLQQSLHCSFVLIACNSWPGQGPWFPCVGCSQVDRALLKLTNHIPAVLMVCTRWTD